MLATKVQRLIFKNNNTKECVPYKFVVPIYMPQRVGMGNRVNSSSSWLSPTHSCVDWIHFRNAFTNSNHRHVNTSGLEMMFCPASGISLFVS